MDRRLLRLLDVLTRAMETASPEASPIIARKWMAVWAELTAAFYERKAR